jgi:hypothetical protein
MNSASSSGSDEIGLEQERHCAIGHPQRLCRRIRLHADSYRPAHLGYAPQLDPIKAAWHDAKHPLAKGGPDNLE